MRKQLTLALAMAGLSLGAVAWALGGGAVVQAASPTSPPSPSALPAPASGSPLATLMANGTLTQAQATAIQNALVAYRQAHWPPTTGWSNGQPPVLASNGPLDTVLAGLVKDGTLTQAQATALENAVTTQVGSRFAGGTGPWGIRGGAPFGGPRGGPPWSGTSS
jgi:hypothetical protein